MNDSTTKFYSDGTIAVKMKLDANDTLANLIRFGMTMGVSDEFAQTTYYGNGPWENYVDRKQSAEIGEFSQATDQLFTNYAMPQENGNRTETRWIKMTSLNGKSNLKVWGNPTFSFSVWPYSQDNLAKAKHPYELMKQGFYTLNIDAVQAGLGGTLSHTLPDYVLKPDQFELEFYLKFGEK